VDIPARALVVRRGDSHNTCNAAAGWLLKPGLFAPMLTGREQETVCAADDRGFAVCPRTRI